MVTADGVGSSFFKGRWIKKEIIYIDRENSPVIILCRNNVPGNDNLLEGIVYLCKWPCFLDSLFLVRDGIS